jgi:AraC family transcriptional regulator
MDDCNLPAIPGRSIRHSCGVQDELINQIGLSVLSEMMSPTAAGRMLVETSSLLLAARLARAHLETELIRPPIRSRHRLDDGRLRRVLAYIHEHLAEDMTVADLASVAKETIATGRASLSEIALDCQFSSQSSFTRAFRRATGMTPAEYRHALR